MTQSETAPKCLSGVLLTCPMCGNAEACINVHLGDLADAETDAFDCRECGETFGTREVRRFIERWTAVLAWLEQVPQFPEAE